MKGFTLIELMGVITILAILSVITVVGVDKLLLNGKEDLYKNQIDIIELSTKNYLTDYPNLRPNDNESIVITLQELVDKGYIDSNINNPKTNEPFDLTTQIKITKNSNNFEYKVMD